MTHVTTYAVIGALALCLTPYPGGSAFAQESDPVCGDRFLLSVGYDGEILNGDKDTLSHAVRMGEQIYVGWALDWDSDGQDDVVHWHDAVFLSVFSGEVFTQTPRIEAQAPIPDPARIQFGNSITEWVGVLGTNGKMTNRFGDMEPGSMAARSWWCKAG